MVALLIAEDDEDIALVLTRLFRRAGTTVRHAPDGQAALEMIIESRPDVLLTDLGMPRLDGWGLIQALRGRPDLQDLPIAVLSGHLRPGDARADEAAVCAVLLKPCPNDRLLAVVGDLAAHGPHGHAGSPVRCLIPEPISV